MVAKTSQGQKNYPCTAIHINNDKIQLMRNEFKYIDKNIFRFE